MFPSLFSNSRNENLHYDVCELAEHKFIKFIPPSNRSNVPLILFAVILNDLQAFLTFREFNSLTPLLMIALG